jgi:hypothetical protein
LQPLYRDLRQFSRSRGEAIEALLLPIRFLQGIDDIAFQVEFAVYDSPASLN